MILVVSPLSVWETTKTRPALRESPEFRKTPLLLSTGSCCGVQFEAQGSDDLHDGGELRVAFRRERLIESFPGKLRHAAGDIA